MSAFDLDMNNPFPTGNTRSYGGPNQGGHVPPNWYIQYGMDLGAVGGTEIVAAFDGHVTKLDTTNLGLSGGKVYGAQLFMRSDNDGMGAFYTHFNALPDGLGPGSQITRGEVLGRVIDVPGSTHLHLALVEIANGEYHGVDLYNQFLSTAGTSDVFTVTFPQDGVTPPSVSGGGVADLSSVYAVQQGLTTLGYNPGEVDGINGQLTREALSTFQRDNGLPISGEMDPLTNAALHAALADGGFP